MTEPTHEQPTTTAAESAPPAGYGAAPAGYPPPGYPAGYPMAAPRNGLGIAALVCGIIGALAGLIPILFWLAGVLGILAIVFGLVGRGRAKRAEATNRGQATAGFVLGVVAVVLAIVGVVIIGNAVNDFSNNMDCIANSDNPSDC